MSTKCSAKYTANGAAYAAALRTAFKTTDDAAIIAAQQTADLCAFWATDQPPIHFQAHLQSNVAPNAAARNEPANVGRGDQSTGTSASVFVSVAVHFHVFDCLTTRRATSQPALRLPTTTTGSPRSSLGTMR